MKVRFRVVYGLLAVATLGAMSQTGSNISNDVFIYRNQRFENFTLPGIGNAWPTAINNSGDVTGFVVASGCFVTAGSRVERFNPPDATKCSPRGINDSGVVVGWYEAPRGDLGFIKSGARITAIIIDGCFSTGATGINNKGQVVGTCFGRPGDPGYLRNADGTVTFFAVPDAKSMSPTGIDDSGRIVGFYYTNGEPFQRAFLYSSGFFKELTVPRCYHPEPTSISPGGLIVGHCVNDDIGPGEPISLSFVVNADAWASKILTDPNGKSISPTGINDHGDMVGTWSEQSRFPK